MDDVEFLESDTPLRHRWPDYSSSRERCSGRYSIVILPLEGNAEQKVIEDCSCLPSVMTLWFLVCRVTYDI